MGKPIAFIPGYKYPSISITGGKCWLMCSYCRGRFLKNMIHVYSPEELYSVAEEYWVRGAYGLLISGGFTRDGVLPYKPYLETIKRIKRDFNLIISIHSGFVDRRGASELREAGVDIVDYELILHPMIIRDLKNLDKRVEDILDSYNNLLDYGPPYIAPHIPLGLTNSYEWVYETIDYLKTTKPETTVFLINMIDSVNVDEVYRILKYAHDKQIGEISLGCMRPYTFKKTYDDEIIKTNQVDRIANPTKQTIMKYNLEIIETCCSIPLSNLFTLRLDKKRSPN